MNRTGKILTAWALLVGASTLSQCDWTTNKETKKDLVELLGKEKKDCVETNDNTASFLVDQYVDNATDDVETSNSYFSVKISDLEWTPFFWKRRMISPSYWNFLWFSQAETIINDYNKGHKHIQPTDWVSTDETLTIPFIYPELKSYFPENWSDLVTMFPEYKDISENDLIFIARCDNWKSALSYYKNGKLKLATYVSLGNPHIRKAIRTTSWVFTLKIDIERRRSNAYWRSPMPYSIHVEWAWNWWVFLHQWKVDWSNLSHWCCRVPWLYQQYLYQNLPKYSKWILHNLYTPTLIKH